MVDFGPSEKPIGRSFGAVVGQSALKRAAMAVATNDAMGGLLVRGEKGTAKSTVVRSVAALLPDQRVVADCPYGCPPDDPGRQCADCRSRAGEELPVAERSVPFVTLPLGATRERVTGSLSVADALDGEESFEPGVLARANRGFCYVDEVNLLDDHLVDVLLDAAASGVNRVERDGVSVTHPASFTLVGTMNPEEGELRPQLRDRFAVAVDVTACEDVDDRVAVVARALGDRTDGAAVEASGESEGSPAGTGTSSTEAGASSTETGASSTAGDARGGDSRTGEPVVVGDDPARRETDPPAAATARRRQQLREARETLPAVRLPASVVAEIAAVCRDAGVDGHRADIAAARTARALAALEGRREVTEADAREAVEFALPHRLRSRPFEEAADPSDALDDHFDDADDRGDGEAGDGKEERDETGGETGADGGDEDGSDEAGSTGDESECEGSTDDGSARGESGSRPESDADEDSGRADSGDGPAVGGNDRSRDDEDRGTAGSEESGTSDADRDPTDDPTDGQTGDGEGDETATPLVPGSDRAGVGESDAPDVRPPEARRAAGGHGSADAPPSTDGDGPRVRTERGGDATTGGGVDPGATVRAASRRGATTPDERDLRQSVHRTDAAALITFVVDASASMRPAMRAAKGTVLDLLRDAYEGRDRVAFVAFAGSEADVVLPPTDSVTRAARHLKRLPTGERTPLPAGLRTAARVVERADPAASLVVLVTDGRANVADSPTQATRGAAREIAATDSDLLVVDADLDTTGVLDSVLRATDGDRVPLEALAADALDARVTNSL